MKTRKILFNYFVIVGLAAAATPLYSTTVEYSSRSSWLAAVSGGTTTTFDTGYSTPPAPGGAMNLGNGGITLNGVTFQSYDDGVGHPQNTPALYALTIVNAGPSSQYYNWGTGGAILIGEIYQGALAHLHMSFATAVTAWGTDLMLGNGVTGNYSIKINDGTCPTACLAPTFAFPTAAFFGMTSDTPINFIDLYVPINGRPELDNFSTATAIVGGGGGGGDIPSGDTPEMATILLCATGLISLAKFKKIRSLSFS